MDKVYQIVWFGEYCNPNFSHHPVFNTLEKAVEYFNELKWEKRNTPDPIECYSIEDAMPQDLYAQFIILERPVH